MIIGCIFGKELVAKNTQQRKDSNAAFAEK